MTPRVEHDAAPRVASVTERTLEALLDLATDLAIPIAALCGFFVMQGV